MRRISYSIPWASTTGGIQVFARDTARSISDWNVEIVEFEYQLRLRDELVLRTLPRSRAKQLYRQMQERRSPAASHDRTDELRHHWHVVPATFDLTSPYVVTCHGSELLTANVRGRYQFELYGEALRRARCVTADSRFTTRYLIEHYGIPSHDIHVVTPGVDLDDFPFFPASTSDRPVIGTLARLIPRKNVPAVIRALSIVRESYGHDFVYYLAGTGPELQRILRGLRDAPFEYEYFGAIDASDLRSVFYPALDVFVMPALWTRNDVEGFGIVYLEANATGVPVVAASSGGVPDAVEDGRSGLFADPLDPEDLARKIDVLLTERGGWRAQCREWAERFDVAATGSAFEALYQETLVA